MKITYPKKMIRQNHYSTGQALFELIYAIHSMGSFNNGNVDIKDIAKATEKTLGIDFSENRKAM